MIYSSPSKNMRSFPVLWMGLKNFLRNPNFHLLRVAQSRSHSRLKPVINSSSIVYSQTSALKSRIAEPEEISRTHPHMRSPLFPPLEKGEDVDERRRSGGKISGESSDDRWPKQLMLRSLLISKHVENCS